MTEGHKMIQKRKTGRKSTNIIWVTQLNEKLDDMTIQINESQMGTLIAPDLQDEQMKQ